MTRKADPKRERETATDRLLRAYRERGDERARDRVVQLYLPLVDTLARRHEGPGATHQELMRAGEIGLADAIQRYSLRRGDFLGFALPIVAGEIEARRGTGDAAGDFDLRDERVQLASAFRALDETEHAVVHLLIVEGLSSDQIARRLGIPEQQASRHRDAALAKIRGQLEGLGSGAASADRPPAEQEVPGAEPEPPAENAKDGHSGRLLLRMPQSLHTELANAAEREEVSLNQFITNTLAAAVGWQQAGDRPAADRPGPRAPTPRWLPAAIVTNIVVLAIAGILAVIILLAGW